MDDLSVESKTDMDDPAEVDDKINDEAIVGGNPSSIDEHVKGHYTSGDEPNIGENVDRSENVLNYNNLDEDNKTKSKDPFIPPKNPKPFQTGAKVPDNTVKRTDDLHSTEVDPSKNENNVESKGPDLLLATKSKKKPLALKLLNEGADIHYLDETKCNVMHYAARAGYDDLIIKLVSLGGSVKLWDCNGDTPLHKAARAGNETTVVVLASYGADVKALNWDGYNALEIAVQKKHINVVDVVCMFGADLVMHDWKCLEDTKKSDNKKDQDIWKILMRQNDRSPGFKHGGIAYSVQQIEQDNDTTLQEVGLTVEAKQLTSPFSLYCCKLQAEYINVLRYVTEGQELFGDVYECRTWGSTKKVLTLNLKISGIPQKNEVIEIISPDGKIGLVESTSMDDKTNCTEVTVTISIKHNAITTFMLVTLEKPEVFAITNSAVTIQPQMEPEAEIEIPTNTFDTPGDLLFNIVQTKDVNVADEESNEEALLLTNVLDLSMSNHQQPKQPIVMKLPIHATVNNETEIVIFTSSKEYPEDVEDWEIIDATQDSRKKCAAFDIRHFSIFTAAQKPKDLERKKAVTMMIQKALKKEREVEFFAFVKMLSATEYAVAIECALQRKSKKRMRYWHKKDYEEQDVPSFSYTVQIDSWFRVTFGGNIRRIGDDQNKAQKLMFQPNRENYKIFSVELVDPKDPPMGGINIELIEHVKPEPIEVIKTSGLCKGKSTYIYPDPVETYFELTFLPVHLKQPLPEPELNSEQSTVITDYKRDNQCRITVLRTTSMKQLGKRLTMEEAHYLAAQLKVGAITEMSLELPNIEDFVDAFLWKWRGMRPYSSQVEFLINALVSMDKQYEADEFRLAHLEDREVRFL